MTLTAGSLFSGIGGLDLGASLAGFDIQFHVEIEEFCRKVLNKHANQYWPNAKQFADVRTVGKHNLPIIDCLFGGFPCQDISYAGRGAGIKEGTRSGLWFEFRRVISELRPTVVLLENVPAILNRGGTGVIADLAALGYVGQWGIISAADAGAPHQRERWFCVAYAREIRRGQRRNNRQERPLLHNVNGDASQGQPEWQGRQRGIGAISEVMADAESRRRSAFGTSESKERSTGTSTRNSTALGNPTSAGLEGADRREPAFGEHTGHGEAVVGDSELSGRNRITRGRSGAQLADGYTQSGGRQAQPRIRGNSHGLPGWLDFVGFPARPGEQQHAYEPPRTAPSTPTTNARIKALGNAVLPQVAYPIFAAIAEWLAEVKLSDAA